MEKRWQIAPSLSPQADEALNELPPLLRQILFNRGYPDKEQAAHFLAASPPSGSEPLAMPGVPEAVERLEAALLQGERIVVYGDYDTDGVTACALLVQTLRALGGEAHGYIPNRFEEGYGLNTQALDEIKAEGTALVVTVDCGIRALKEAEHAAQIGLDLIVSDHHTPGPELPRARACINPKLPGGNYPEKNLAGVGVAYKLACALLEGQETTAFSAQQLLDLVALGTVADLAPLAGENRHLVRAGLKQLRRPHRQGVMALIGVAGLKPQRLEASHIGFMLGPRLNAAGRLDTAQDAYNLLLTDDVFTAGKLAQRLDNQNRQRQRITDETFTRAEALVTAEDPDAALLFAFDPEFNPGVVGLAASRLVERHYRPAIVGQEESDTTRASCRSIPEFHITEALQQCADLFEHFGGHAAAAGFTIQTDKVPELKERLHAIAEKTLRGQDLRPVLHADAEVPLAELKPELLEHLDLLEPTGYGNPKAAFVSRGLGVQRSYPVGKKAEHLKLVVSDGWVSFDAIAFRQGHWHEQMPEQIDLLYHFELNEFRGQKKLQLNVRDLKPSQG